MNPAAARARWRRLVDDPAGRRPLEVGLAAPFTVELLVPHLGGALADLGFQARFTAAPGLAIQGLLDVAGPLRAGRLDVAVVLPLLDDLCADALRTLSRAGPDVPAARRRAHREMRDLCDALVRFADDTTTPTLCANLAPPRSLPLGLLDAGHEASLESVRALMNLRLWRTASRHPLLGVFDIASEVAGLGTEASYDPRLWYLARCPFGHELLARVGRRLARAIAARFRSPAKLVVVDLDGTLWGGVLGEDGPDAIALGDEGLGACHAAFQEALLDLRAHGVLIAVASRNDEPQALHVIDDHPGMRLRRRHLAAWRIGWGRKVDALRELAAELGVGLDAVVFVDDDPVERAAVRQLLPEVRVLDLPEDAALYVDALREESAFDRADLTRDDLERAGRYSASRLHVASKPTEPAALAAFLASLDLRVSVRLATARDLPRAAQLTQRTNQFNLTTRRREAGELERLRRSAEHLLLVAEVSDRFGDYGITGLAIAERRSGTSDWWLDTFLLSCRVLGRGVETALLRAVADAVLERGGSRLGGGFRPTARNGVAAGFLTSHGFREDGSGEAWIEPLDAAPPAPPHVALAGPTGVVGAGRE